jgi:hypothetical protein
MASHVFEISASRQTTYLAIELSIMNLAYFSVRDGAAAITYLRIRTKIFVRRETLLAAIYTTSLLHYHMCQAAHFNKTLHRCDTGG